MEFVAVLLLLYGLHCLVHLQSGALLFAGRGRRFSVAAGPGWRLAHPIPSFSNLIAERPLWIEEDGALCARGITPRWIAHGLSPSRPRFDPGSPGEVDTKGSVVRVGGVGLARAPSEARALRLAGWLEGLVGKGLDAFPSAHAEQLAEETSLATLREERERIEAASRWLRPLLDLYALTLFVVLPIAIAWSGSEPALWSALPVLLALHLACLVAWWRADRQLRAAATGGRGQTLFEIALYPPSLLRILSRLEIENHGRFHPAALAAELLTGRSRSDFLRAELVRARQAAERPASMPLADLELAALTRLLEAADGSPASLLAAPTRQDPLALAFCPACHTEYRRSDGACGDCGYRLRPYPGRSARSRHRVTPTGGV